MIASTHLLLDLATLVTYIASCATVQTPSTTHMFPVQLFQTHKIRHPPNCHQGNGGDELQKSRYAEERHLAVRWSTATATATAIGTIYTTHFSLRCNQLYNK
ncbi:hypothetical protein EB077_05125 [bacterium]|nr:hypothetical protein [bacterium]